MKTVRKKIYSVSFYYNNSPAPYHTITNCDWELVKELRRRAKLIGEKVTYEHTDTRVDHY